MPGKPETGIYVMSRRDDYTDADSDSSLKAGPESTFVF